MTRPRKQYTTGELKRIRELRAQRKTFREIAEILGRNTASVATFAKRNGVQTGKLRSLLISERQEREIVAALEAGATRAEMCRRYGVARWVIDRIPGIPTRNWRADDVTVTFTMNRELREHVCKYADIHAVPVVSVFREAVSREIKRISQTGHVGQDYGR